MSQMHPLCCPVYYWSDQGYQSVTWEEYNLLNEVVIVIWVSRIYFEWEDGVTQSMKSELKIAVTEDIGGKFVLI